MFVRGIASSMVCGLFFAACVALSPGPATARGLSAAQKQAATENPSARRKYANEPYVFERHFLAVRFEKDGTGTRELSARVRIQTDAGAQQFRQLVFSFVSPNEEVSVRSATIHTASGSTIDVRSQPNATKVGPSSVTQKFPAYSDLKELRVALPNLKAGDTLDYEVVTRIIQPFAPGEFWFSYDFPHDSIILDDRLEINLPQGRAFSIEAPGISRTAGATLTPATEPLNRDVAFSRTDEAGRTILRWSRANLKRVSADQDAQPTRAASTPDIQITSFHSWAQVAHWYAQREQTVAQVTPAIQTKVQELTRGVTNGPDKATAVCAYVSQKIRDVDLADEFGQIASRSAQDVLAAGYGDSEEKNALLAAMLGAAGIHSNVALVAHGLKLQPGFPSPSQFDHAVTIVRDGEKQVWIDPSSEFAPFGFLPAPLRGKTAFAIDANGTGKIVDTPADPPFLSTQNVAIAAQVSPLGKVSGTVHYTLRGDTEYVLRTAFHQAPRTQWNSLGQTILTLDGLRGQVTNVTTGDPFATTQPFQVTIAFSDPNAFTWPMERAKIALPLLTIGLPDPPAKRDEPIKLGTPLDVETHLRLRFPPEFTVTAPIGTVVARDYAEFKSSYRIENGELVAERALNFKMRELPASREPDYLAFAHAVQADAAQALLIGNPAGAKAEIPPNATADDLVAAGTSTLKSGNTRAAIRLLQRATQLQSNHKSAWNELGLAYIQAQQFADAAAAFQKHVQIDPSDQRVHDYLGVALEQLHRDDDAADAFRKQIAIEPLDPVAHAQLGNLLLRQERYSDAVTELQKAVILSPDNAELEILLGRAYLNVGDSEKALASLRKATKISPTAQIRNEAAYTLAEHGTDLDEARQYAEAAIRVTANSLEKADLAHVTAADFAESANLGAYWDTMGWIYFRKGDLVRAKQYIGAAWMLTENGEVGDHLAEIYAKSGEKERAIHQCALALAGTDPVPDTRARLILLLGGNAQIDDLVRKARPELERMHTLDLALPATKKTSADFLIAMSPGGKTSLAARVDAVRFFSGDGSLRQFEDKLKTVDYGEVFPEATPLKLIRRANLTCPGTGNCKFTLLPAGTGASD